MPFWVTTNLSMERNFRVTVSRSTIEVLEHGNAIHTHASLEWDDRIMPCFQQPSNSAIEYVDATHTSRACGNNVLTRVIASDIVPSIELLIP
jgi:hypothetical protein